VFFTQFRFTALGDLQSIVTHGLDVQGDLDREEVGERIDRQAIRDEGGPCGLHQKELGGDRLGEER